MNISVCIATYNGEVYVKEQISSILSEIELNDELIIVDDCSKDNTVDIIKNLNDDRIKIYKNETNKGHVFTFAKAIEIANNDLIFLSDQDDIWEKGRINTFKYYFNENDALLISSNFSMFNESEIINMVYPLIYNDSNRYIHNIYGIILGKRAYYGCAMAFRKKFKEIILPIPNYVESHDLWVALAANILKSNLHIEEITLRKRIHDNNVTNPNRNFMSKIRTRINFLLRAIFDLNFRIIRKNLGTIKKLF